MVSIRADRRTGQHMTGFRFGGRQFQRSLQTASRRKATAIIAIVEETILLVERGTITLPPDADPPTFFLSDGRVAKTETLSSRLPVTQPVPKSRAAESIENLLREDLRPIEQAKAFASLIELNGWNGKQALKPCVFSQPPSAEPCLC